MTVRNLQIPVIAFHKVDPRFEWGVTRVFPNQFRSVLAYLKENNYQTIPLHDALNGQSDLPAKPIALTFDDSYQSIYQYAFPLLQEFNFTATVFVISGYAGSLNQWDVNLGGKKFRHLSWPEIKELANAGFEIGSHTVHHPDLTRISTASLEKELKESKRHIEDMTGKQAHIISFPFGRYDDRVIEWSRKTGYQHGCGFWIRKKSHQPFVFERKAYYLFDNKHNLRAKLDDHWGRGLENAKLRIINFCSHGTSLVKPARFNRYRD